MTGEEFKAFTRGLANPAVKYKRGEISGDELYKSLYVVLGKDTFVETEQLLDEVEKR